MFATVVAAEQEEAGPIATDNVGDGQIEDDQRPRIRVVSIRASREVTYEAESGEPTAASQLTVVVGIRPGGASIRALEGILIEEATTLGGQELRALVPTRESGERFWQNFSRRLDLPTDSSFWEHGEVRIPVRFEDPGSPIEGFARVTGEIRLALATGDRRKVVMDPLEEWVEESIQISGLSKGFLVTKRPDDGRISLHMSNQLAPLFEDLRLFDADRQPIAIRRGSVERAPGQGVAIFTGDLADATRAEFVYVDAVETVAVPFAFKDLSFQPPASSESAKVVDPVPDEAP